MSTVDPAGPAEEPEGREQPAGSQDDATAPPGGARRRRRFSLHKPGGEPVRAGRNLPLATITGVLLGALVLLSLLTLPATFVLILTVGHVLGVRELNRALLSQDVRIAVVPILAGGAAMLAASYFGGARWLLGGLLVTLVVAAAWRLLGGAQGYARDIAASSFAVCYVPLLLSTWLLLLATPQDGTQRLIAFIIVTISSDIAGYFAGILAGRHKMAPSISPNKTWEGFAGSLLGCMAAGALSVYLLLDGPVWAGVILGAAVCVAAIVGDLIESLIKRDTGVKDMGSFLPGHGGLLDRLDSLLVAAPVAWVVLSLLV